MKALFHIIALVIFVCAIVSFIKADPDSFRFGIILGMLCNIYAEVTD